MTRSNPEASARPQAQRQHDLGRTPVAPQTVVTAPASRRRYVTLASWSASRARILANRRVIAVCACGHASIAHGYSCDGVTEDGLPCACLRSYSEVPA